MTSAAVRLWQNFFQIIDVNTILHDHILTLSSISNPYCIWNLWNLTNNIGVKLKDVQPLMAPLHDIQIKYAYFSFRICTKLKSDRNMCVLLNYSVILKTRFRRWQVTGIHPCYICRGIWTGESWRIWRNISPNPTLNAIRDLLVCVWNVYANQYLLC